MIPLHPSHDPPRQVRLHIVEDDVVVGQCLASLVADQVDEVLLHGSAEEFLERYDRDSACALLLDVSLPGMDGLKLLEILDDERSMLPTLVMSADAAAQRVVAAIRRGAVDFLPKPLEPRTLIHRVGQLVAKVGPATARRRLRRHRLRALERLTPREREVFDLLARGASAKQIAGLLGMQLRTAHIHRTNVLRKFEAETPVELAHIAALLGGREGLEFDRADSAP